MSRCAGLREAIRVALAGEAVRLAELVDRLEVLWPEVPRQRLSNRISQSLYTMQSAGEVHRAPYGMWVLGGAPLPDIAEPPPQDAA